MKRRIQIGKRTVWFGVGIACMSLLAAGPAQAQTAILSVKSGNWSDPTVWTGGSVPAGSGQMARPTSSHVITITGAVADVYCTADTTGGLILTNEASLVVGWGKLAVGGSYHDTLVKQYAGTLTIASNNLELGTYSASDFSSRNASFSLYGGTLVVSGYLLNGANVGTVFNQYGGMMTITGDTVNAIYQPITWAGSWATTNTFNQYGGTNVLYHGVSLAGRTATSDPRYAGYNLYGGEQRLAEIGRAHV